MRNCYVLKDYNKEKKIIVCKICNSQKKVKNSKVKDHSCCNDEEWEFEKDFDIYRKRAFKKGLEFSLTRYEFEHLISSKCFYCKSAPRRMKDGLIRNGIDRVDNNIGYTRKNTICSCTTCNFMKRTLTLEEFRDKINNIATHINTIAETRDIYKSFGLLFNSGYTDIDLDMCLALHSMKLITLNEEVINSYVNSITNNEDVINYLVIFARKVKMGVRTENLKIKESKYLLKKMVRMCADLVDEGGLRLCRPEDGYSTTKNTTQILAQIIPYERRD